MASQLTTYLGYLEKQLEEKNKLTEALAFLETKTGVKKLYLAAGKLTPIILQISIY
jgi:hypothetical protein